MSLINQFKSLTETKILMLEVSKGKRNALLEKIAKYYLEDTGKPEIYQRVLNLIDNQPILIERIYGEFFKKNLDSPAKRKRYFEDKFDVEEIIPEKYRDLTPKYQHEMWWGVIGLVGCVKLFKDLESVDPTGNMKYGNWLVDVVLQYAIEKNLLIGQGAPRFKNSGVHESLLTLLREGGRFYEDLPKLQVYLEAYDEMKRKNVLPEKFRDINKIGDDDKNPIVKLGRITKSYRVVGEGDFFKVIEEKLQEGRDYEKVFNDVDGYSMYLPQNQKARSILGMNTEWCTTYGEHCLNPEYSDRSPMDYEDLIILVDNGDPSNKIQMHFGSDQFMDENDDRIRPDVFFTEHPTIFEWLMEIQAQQIDDWFHSGHKGSQFMRMIAAYDKYSDLFESIISEMGYPLPKNNSNNGSWQLNYSEERAWVLTTDLEWMKDSFGKGAQELSIDEFLRKFLETRESDVAKINKGNYKYHIELSPRFGRAWIAHYNNIVNYNELEMYK